MIFSFSVKKWKPGKRIWRKLLVSFFLFALVFITAALSFWYILPRYVKDPLAVLSKHTPARSFYDRNGELIKRVKTSQYQWRLDLPLSRISPEAVKVILAAEDANFYNHKGIDPSAVIRAFFQNMTSGRIVSGASTISMQLASLAMRENGSYRRSFSGKITQALMARKLEMCHSKNEILKEYLNRIPFGGPIAGIGAASIYYFGLPAEKLNMAEASLLCGLPQRPNYYRPDRNLPRARKRQKRVLYMLERKGFLQKGEAEKIYRDLPLRLRDFSVRSPLPGDTDFLHDFFLRQAEAEMKNSGQSLPDEIFTTLDQELSKHTLNILKTGISGFEDVHDAAAVVIDNKKMQFLVYIGTLDFSSPEAGQVDAASAIRSAGSTLKPFIYAEGINGGLVCKDSFFMDAPLRYKDYAPVNFDGKFRGKVTLEKALQMSLNTTAVKMLEILGEERISELFSRVGLSGISGRKNGLSLALGSAGYTLKDLVNAFTVFPNKGIFRKGSFLNRNSENDPSPSPSGQQIWHPGTAGMIKSILTRRIPPFGEMDVIWKTGTSNGNYDAWCIAATEDYTAGVWLGNKSGRASRHLTGITAAAPCAAEILKLLYPKGTFPFTEGENESFLTEKLCTESGRKHTPFCAGFFYGTRVKDIPLANCTQCRNQNRKLPLKILSPKGGNYILPEGKKFLEIPLAADQKEVYFFTDGIRMEKNTLSHRFGEGIHTVSVMDPAGKKRPAEVTFQIIRKASRMQE